ncbi:MAG: thiamine phosphate synthase [Kiritimatiellia bacterium]
MSIDFSQPFGLYLVITNPVTSYETVAEAAVRAEVRFIQLRMKHVARAEILERARTLRSITRGSRTLLIINDDPSIAVESEADGVHLGQGDQPLPEARAQWQELKIFGLSTHSFEQMTNARHVQPDYIGVGPLYATPTKDIPDPTLGAIEAGRIIQSAPCPAVAIGGIDCTRLPEVLRAGAINYSVVRAVCGEKDPYSAICRLQEIWQKRR